MDLVLRQPIPYKSLDFMLHYLRMYYSLTGRQKWHRFRPLFFLLVLKTVHYLLMTFYEPPSITLKLVFNDILRLTNLPPAIYLIIVGSFIMSGYYIYLNYFETMLIPLDFFAEVMDDCRQTTFLISNYMPGGGQQLISQYLKRYCFVILNMLQIFILDIDLFVLLSQFYGVQAILQLPLSPAFQISALISAELNIFTLYGALYTFSLANMILGSLLITLLEAIRLLMKQLEKFLEVGSDFNWKSRKWRKCLQKQASTFRREYTRLVIFFSRNNRYVAQALVPMLLVNCPSTTLLINTLLNSYFPQSSQTKKFHPEFQLVMVIALLEQFLSIFIVHLLFANRNGRLRLLARRYILLSYVQSGGQLLYKNKEKGSQRQQLLSYLFLERFHTTKPYGFTYHTFGYISRFNFVKYLLLYSELFMFVYQTGF